MRDCDGSIAGHGAFADSYFFGGVGLVCVGRFVGGIGLFASNVVFVMRSHD